MKLIQLFLCCLFIHTHALANCYESAGRRYGVDPLMLQAMARVESTENPGAIGLPLSDGNVALGTMQINTIHLADLKEYHIFKKDLFNECININLGAWQFSKNIKRFGAVWKAVGAYNTGPNSNNVEAQQRYIKKVYSAYETLKKRKSLKSRKNTEFELSKKEPETRKEKIGKIKVWNDDDDD